MPMTLHREEDRSLPPAKVLLVDDNQPNLLAFSAVLEPLGHELILARSGHEALDRTQKETFAVIVMDVQMPGMDGLETVRRLRGFARASRTPIIFVSATRDDREHIMGAYELGAIDYLTKPIEPEILKAKVEALALLHQQSEQLKLQAELIALKEREAADAIEARRRAEHSNLLKDRFIGILGHDLRTPLSVVSVTAETLLRLSPAEGPIRSAATRLKNAGDHMQRMIADLIDFTRGQLGDGIPVSRTSGSFAKICQFVVDELSVIHTGRQIRLDLAGKLSGQWDAARVGQAVANLVGNALEHGAGLVTVTAREEPAHVMLSVHNWGTPIPPEQLRDIFEPFKHGPTKAQGLGLGLYIVREIVRGHGGTVHVSSSADKGTCFVTNWPR
jgi:two-component system sensor histidine kinase/response regulator